MVAAVFPVCIKSDTITLSEAFMLSALHIAVFFETLEGIHTKYSVNKQQVNK